MVKIVNYEKLFDHRNKDWIDILKQLNNTGIEKTENIKIAYLRNISLLCNNIKEHPARDKDMRNTEILENFKHLIYEMTSLFYNFGNRMMKINESAEFYKQETISFEWLEGSILSGDIGIPGCHSMIEYSRAITVHNIDTMVQFIDLNINEIVNYIEADGMALPEYMYQAHSNHARGIHGELRVEKYKLIRSIGEESQGLKLPYYYKLSDLTKDQLSYRERFYSKERYEKFLLDRFPVICWMHDHGMQEEDRLLRW